MGIMNFRHWAQSQRNNYASYCDVIISCTHNIRFVPSALTHQNYPCALFLVIPIFDL